MTLPTLAANLQRLDCLLSDLPPDVREAIDLTVASIIRTSQDHANAAEFWESTALRYRRESESLYAQIEALRGKILSLEACVRDMNAMMNHREMFSRVFRQFLVNRERERLMRAAYGGSLS